MNEPIFLMIDEVLQIHARSLADHDHGGRDGIRDPGLVESALASAKKTFYLGQVDVFEVAADHA